MSLQSGHFRTRPPKGSRNCFFCHKDVKKFQLLQLEKYSKFLKKRGLEDVGAAMVCCEECYKRPDEELAKEMSNYVILQAILDFREGRRGLIRDKKEFNEWWKLAKENGVIKAEEEHERKRFENA